MNCKTCGDKKVMYYQEWCPRCEKPEPKLIISLNLLQAMYHIDRIIYGETNQNIDPPGKEELWVMLCDYGYIKNDTYTSVCFPSLYEDCLEDREYEEDKDKDKDKDMMEYIKNLINEFDLTKKKTILWEVSW